ncbi:MAG: hypothetical protein ABW042_06710 [Phenylobacterium sp.]
MPPPDRAAQAALAEARWTACDLLARRGPALAADLLRGQAAELAGSQRVPDRLLADHLDRAADDIEQGRPPLLGSVGCSPSDLAGEGGRRWLRIGAALLALGVGLLAIDP